MLQIGSAYLTNTPKTFKTLLIYKTHFDPPPKKYAIEKFVFLTQEHKDAT
ncbi:hypothetical protein DWUX_2621 [Desulfovibrio diazotrophicus]|nr:hypothetical protein DWUX_2621 [Desulfovibrio diazotrophicus]